MFRTPVLALCLACGCHGFFGARTSDEDQELNNFAEARLRAATYYDGADYERAAIQYKQALEYRPDHVPSRLGYAYSELWTQKGLPLTRARDEFIAIGKQADPNTEVKRIFGLAMTYRSLGKVYQAQSLYHDRTGNVDARNTDIGLARDNADKAISLFERVLGFDEELAKKQTTAPLRVTASLTPDAHAGMAHCYIIKAGDGDAEPLEEAASHIRIFSETAAKARRFWSKRRERVLAIDPMREGEEGRANTQSVRGQERMLYERRILRTIDEEAAMRRALVEVYVQLRRFEDAIAECDAILELDGGYDQVYWIRGQAHASLTPPDYNAALKDIREYRKRKSKDGLTDELVRVNRWIKQYEAELAKRK